MISFSNHRGQHVPKMTHTRTYLVFGDFWSPHTSFSSLLAYQKYYCSILFIFLNICSWSGDVEVTSWGRDLATGCVFWFVMRTDARSRVGWDWKGKKDARVLCQVCGLMFFVIFWIVLLRFLMLSSLMSLLVSWIFQSCHVFEVFLCHLKLHQFFKMSWLCHLSFYVCFLRYCIMSTYVIGGYYSIWPKVGRARRYAQDLVPRFNLVSQCLTTFHTWWSRFQTID